MCVRVIMCHSVFNVWPKTTLLLLVWPRDAKRLDTPAVVWRLLKYRVLTFLLALCLCECEAKNANNDPFSIAVFPQQLRNSFLHSTIKNLKHEGILILYHAISQCLLKFFPQSTLEIVSGKEKKYSLSTKISRKSCWRPLGISSIRPVVWTWKLCLNLRCGGRTEYQNNKRHLDTGVIFLNNVTVTYQWHKILFDCSIFLCVMNRSYQVLMD